MSFQDGGTVASWPRETPKAQNTALQLSGQSSPRCVRRQLPPDASVCPSLVHPGSPHKDCLTRQTSLLLLPLLILPTLIGTCAP